MFHVVPERAHDLSRWRLFVAQEVKVSGVLDEIIIWARYYNPDYFTTRFLIMNLKRNPRYDMLL